MNKEIPRNIFEHKTFEEPPVSKREYLDAYPEYVKRCSSAYKRTRANLRQRDFAYRQHRKRHYQQQKLTNQNRMEVKGCQ
ncbi:MAG: hypothetical protein WBH77_10045 [Saccharofermentanales bacterium]